MNRQQECQVTVPRDRVARRTLTRREILWSGTVAAGLGNLYRRGVAHAQTPIKIGTAVLGDYAMACPVILALERGLFKQEGLEADFVPFRGGPDLLKAVLTGEVLIGVTGSTDIFVFREVGAPIKMLATHTEGNHFTLNVAPDVKSVADLKDKDVKIVALGALDAHLAALARKEIAAFVWGDGGAVTEIQGKSKLLMRMDRVTPKWISQILYTSEDSLAKNSEAIRKAMRAIFRAVAFMREQPPAAAEICEKTLGWPPEAVLGAHKISGPLLPADGQISVEALAVMQDTLLEYGVIKKKLPLAEHVASGYAPVRL